MTTENYHVGGNVPKDHPSYVYRQADEDFYQALLDRQFCYVLNARQMGKSSLLVRTRERLRQAGVACATVDITQIGSDSTLIEWYAGIIRTILDDFHWDDFDLTDWWQSRDLDPLSPLHHLSQFIEKVLLVRTEPQPVVIFIDETDAMRRFGEDFFAMIRSCYNLRSDKPAYQRLTFAILGVVSPSDLIQDKGKTPFNIGKGIELTGFQLAEAVPLLAGLNFLPPPNPLLLGGGIEDSSLLAEGTENTPPLSLGEGTKDSNIPPLLAGGGRGEVENPKFPSKTERIKEEVENPKSPSKAERSKEEVANPKELLRLILQWTGGQPFLTQKVCRLVKENAGAVGGDLEPWLTQLLQEKIINNWEAQDEPAHLRNIRDRLLQKDEKNRARLLGLYQRILQRGEVPTDGSSEQMELRLSGAVVQREGVLRPYNPIYAQVFGEQWVSAQLAAVRPHSEALQGWLNSGKKDQSYLLRGQALQEVLTWAREKSLKSDDYRFFMACRSLVQKQEKKRRGSRTRVQRRLTKIIVTLSSAIVILVAWIFIIMEYDQDMLRSVENLTANCREQIIKNTGDTQIQQKCQELGEQAKRNLSAVYNDLGNLHLQLGNANTAMQAFKQSLEINKRLVVSDSRRVWSLLSSYNNIGDMQLQLGNTNAAVQAYKQSLEICRNLGDVKQQPLDNTNTAVVQAYEQIVISGNCDYYYRSNNYYSMLDLNTIEMQICVPVACELNIRKRLAAADPDSTEAQRDLSVSYNKIGDTHLQLLNTDAAVQAYEQSLEIRKRFATSDPDSTQAQRDLSISYNKLGDVQLRLGNTSAAAVRAYEQSLEIRKRLATSDPDSTQAQRDLSISYNKLGDVQLRLGNTSAAVQAYEQSLEIRKRLATSDPDSTQAQRDLSISYDRLGDVQLRLGNTSAAVQAYEQSLEIGKRLATSDPDSTEAQRDLMISHYKLANIHLANDELPAALASYQQALAITEKLVAQDQLNQQWQEDLAELKSKIDEVKQRLNK